MSKLGKEELFIKLKTIKEEISSLKTKLKVLNKDKEKWFKEKEDLKGEIRKLITKVKGVKSEKDRSDTKINKKKKELDKQKQELRNLINKSKGLNKKKGSLLRKSGLKVDPVKVQQIIDKLETTIETEAISFKKEKQIMDKIKELKKSHKQGKEIFEIMDEMNNISKKIDESKKISTERSSDIYGIRRDKKDYRVFIDISRDINNLRTKQEEAFKKFIDSKKEFSGFGKSLKEKIKVFNEIKKQLYEFRQEEKNVLKRKEEKLLEEKRKDVDIKLRTKKKLTTEDLLVFQENDK